MPLYPVTCQTEIRRTDRVYICGGTLVYRTRNHRDEPAIPFFVCTNPQCGTATRA